MINGFLPNKYNKHLSNTILKHENVLDKVNKLTYVRLLNMTSH